MSNGKLYFGKIDLKKLDPTKFFKSEKTGNIYADVTIWVNDEPDQYGNHISIQQSTKKDEDKIYLGNAKEYVSETQTESAEVKENDLPW